MHPLPNGNEGIANLDFETPDIPPTEIARGLEDDAQNVSVQLLSRLAELTGGNGAIRFDELPMADGHSFRTAVMRLPALDIHAVHAGPTYRVIINQGEPFHAYDSSRRRCILSDIVIHPLIHRFGVRIDNHVCSAKVAETAPPCGMPPHISRHDASGRYALIPSDGYDLPTLFSKPWPEDPTYIYYLRAYSDFLYATLSALARLSDDTHK